MKKTNLTAKQKKQQRFAIIAIVIVLIAILVWRYRNKPVDETVTGTSTTSTSSASSLPKLGNNATLKYGTKSEEVKWVQSYYNSKIAVPLNKTKLAVDGIFGPKTQAAVKSVTGSTSTSWTVFKQTVDGTGSATTASIYTNDWQNSENLWPWQSQP